MWKKKKRSKLHSPSRGEGQGEGVNSPPSGEGPSHAGLSGPSLKEPLAGKIISIHMENFMCHTNLEVTFDKRITFVTGMNGSGKSAIMAALIVTLGGSANTTGRGVGLQEFIMQGTTWARVTLKLNNQGVNSYKNDIYGNQIVIIRTISKNSSTYVCKSEFGETISKKKEEVDRIVTFLDIQIKNPICILNQDVARSFLSTSDSSSRFSMFMKATHLENIKQIYEETEKLLAISRNDLKKKKQAISEATKEVRYAEKKLSCFEALEKKKTEFRTFQEQYLWSTVIDEEKEIRKLTTKKRGIEDEKNELYDRRAKLDDAISNITDNITEIDSRISVIENTQSEKALQLKRLESEMVHLNRQIDTLNSQLNQLISKSERQQSEINSIKEHLQKNEELTSQSQLRREKLADQIKQLRQDSAESRGRIETTQRDSENAMETKLQHTMALENLKTELKDLEQSKKILQVQVERAANAGSSILLKYGPFAPRLRELINDADRRNMFEKKPVGVCGLYATLTGDKWARAVESVVGGLMTTYCCDNQKDFQVLSRIMDTTCGGKNPSIIISKFQKSRYDVSSKKVSVEGFKTVLDVLHFDNDVVFNMFIDQARIETILLLETDVQAAALLANVHTVPKNVRMALTQQSDQYYPAPYYRTYCGDSSRPLKYFDAPPRNETSKDKYNGELQKTNLSINEKNMEIVELTSKLAKVTDFLKKTESNLRLLKQNDRKIEAEINRLKNEEESFPVAPTRLALQDELSILEAKQAELKRKIDEGKQNKEVLLRNKEELLQKIGQITTSETNLSEEVTGLEQQSQNLREKLSVAKNKRESVIGQMDRVQSRLNEVCTQIQVRNGSLKLKLEEAYESRKDRVIPTKSTAELKSIVDNLESYIKAARKNLPSKEDIFGDYEIKMKKFKDIKETAKSMEQVVRSLAENVDRKKENFSTIAKQMASVVNFHFQACLKTRGYSGSLDFDMAKEKLNLQVKAKDGAARTDTKTLSGGERSYSTVSFILAIWRAVQMPFYFLDEFDVFMDRVNRKVIMDLLLDFALQETEMQFIFITPQDISDIQSSDCVSIYKLPDPRQ